MSAEATWIDTTQMVLTHKLQARAQRVFHITEIAPDEQGNHYVVVQSSTEQPVGQELGRVRSEDAARALVNTCAAAFDSCIITRLVGLRQHFLIPGNTAHKPMLEVVR
jgi:hypothetical protein